MSRDRPRVSAELRNKAIQMVVDKMKMRLDKRGNGAFMSSHEILGIITEEYKELTDEVHRSTGNISEELSDIAVGAIFGIASILTGEMDWI